MLLAFPGNPHLEPPGLDCANGPSAAGFCFQERHEFRVASRTFDGAQAFAHRLERQVRTPMRAVATAREAVEGADIIVTITLARNPVVGPGWMEPGALLCAMGGVQEIEFGVLAEIDRLIVDDLGYALLRGSLANWVDRDEIALSDLKARVDADIGEVVCGAKPGRTLECAP